MSVPKKPTISDLINTIEAQGKLLEATAKAMVKLDRRHDRMVQRVESLLIVILNVDALPDLSKGTSPARTTKKRKTESEVSASDLFDDSEPVIPSTGM